MRHVEEVTRNVNLTCCSYGISPHGPLPLIERLEAARGDGPAGSLQASLTRPSKPESTGGDHASSSSRSSRRRRATGWLHKVVGPVRFDELESLNGFKCISLANQRDCFGADLRWIRTRDYPRHDGLLSARRDMVSTSLQVSADLGFTARD